MEKGGEINTVEASLPPGFRFHPRDDELVCDYLINKLVHGGDQSVVLIEVDLNKCEPWDIPQTACVGGKEWYFYSQRDRKYATGLRTNRATATGYWKATGKDRAVLRRGTLVGMRKTLVFYQGRAPRGSKTHWVMHEYRLEAPFGSSPTASSSSFPKEDWVLCRVSHKNNEGASKESTGNSCSDETGSSSLPPLMVSYINFDQTNHQEPYFLDENIVEQVPCFSVSSQNQTNPSTLPNLIGLVSDPKTPTKNPTPLLIDQSSVFGLDSFCSEQMVLRALLSQPTEMDASVLNVKESPSLVEGSSESYLSEVGMPSTAWNYL